MFLMFLLRHAYRLLADKRQRAKAVVVAGAGVSARLAQPDQGPGFEFGVVGEARRHDGRQGVAGTLFSPFERGHAGGVALFQQVMIGPSLQLFVEGQDEPFGAAHL
jgi:hypothetical protein